MNILVVLYGDFTTNSAIHALAYAAEHAAMGHDVVIAIPENLHTFPSSAAEFARPFMFSELLRDRERVFRNQSPADVVHAWTPREVVRKFVFEYMGKWSAPLVVYLEDNEYWISKNVIGVSDDDLRQLSYGEIASLTPLPLSHPQAFFDFIAIADVVVVIQDKLKQDVMPWVPCVEVMPGVDLEFFSPRPKSRKWLDKLGLSDDEKVIVYNGGLNQFTRPGIESLLRSVVLINQQGVKCRMVRTGVNPLMVADEQFAREANGLYFDLGVVERADVPDLLSLADVLIQPGKVDDFEDFRLPAKLPEFMAMGKPVLMPNVNIACKLTEGVEVEILREGSPEEIASKFISITTDHAKCRQLGSGARLFAEKHFNLKHQASRMLEAYRQAMQRFESMQAAEVWSGVNSDSSASELSLRKLRLMGGSGTQNAILSIPAAAMCRQLERLHLALQGRDQRLAVLVPLADEAKKVPELVMAVAERDGRIGLYHQMVSERDTQLDSLRQTLAETSDRIVRLNLAVSERNQAIAQMDGELADLRQAIDDSHAALQEKNQALAEKEYALAVLHSVIEEYRTSTSWKVTKPLRLVSSALKRGVGLLRRVSMAKVVDVFHLVAPHALLVISHPGLVARKLHFLTLAWRSEGYKGVIRRLQHSRMIRESHAEPPENVALNKTLCLMASLNEPRRLLHLADINSGVKVAVIIPVYLGVEETRRCIESVMASTCQVRHEVVVINDASPDPEVARMLSAYDGKYANLTVLVNDENLGFVRTVNRGMQWARGADVVLLNSDTEVANDWLDRLVCQAWADEKIATVTPFSNNATICNYPDLEGWQSLPEGVTVGEMDSACAAANAGRFVPVPTAHGFCMYIKRACIDDVGLFDAEAFGKGYGEENDFSLRATRRGWKHIFATDVFVFHQGSVSFSASAEEKKSHAIRIIRERYPDYDRIISEHISENAALADRVAVTAARYRRGDKPVILFITHGLGGGTEKHIKELADHICPQLSRVLILRSTGRVDGHDVRLQSHDPADRLDIALTSADMPLLGSTLRLFGIDKIHVHHTIGLEFPVESLLANLAVPYDVTVHDYFPICPRVNLRHPIDGYCENPTATECNACLMTEPKGAAIRPENWWKLEINWWRTQYASLLNGANRVICPSNDTASRIRNYFPAAPVGVVAHEEIVLPELPRLAKRKKVFRVALLGVLAEHKGLGLVADVLRTIEERQLSVEIVLIGYTEQVFASNRAFTETGRYEDVELPGLIEKVDPDAILFTAVCPETYSYTLGAALLSGRPVIVPNLGAFPERVVGVEHAFVYPHTLSGPDLAGFLITVSQEILQAQINLSGEAAHHDAQTASGQGAQSRRVNPYYLSADYLPARVAKPGQIREKVRPLVLVVPEFFDGVPSICSFIRLFNPLMEAEVQAHFEIRIAAFRDVANIKADIVVINRVPCERVDGLSDFLAHIRDTGAKLIYDIDDHLLELHDNHPEARTYKDRQAVVSQLLSAADMVWASTDVLSKALTPVASQVVTMENYLKPEMLDEPVGGVREHYPLEKGVFHILYMGTTSHAKDLEIVLDAIRRLNSEGTKVHLHLLGICENAPNESWIKVIRPPARLSSYPLFFLWFRSLPKFDLGIAPLEDALFNRCKSPIKFWDYTSMGIPTLASNVDAYNRIIVDGETGFLASNVALDWYEKIRNIMSMKDRLGSIVLNAKTALKKIYVELDGVSKRKDAMLSLLMNESGSGFAVPPSRESIAAKFLRGSGIEIGALHNPLAVPECANVRYVDRMPKEKLYEHYPELRAYSLVDVDIVDDGEYLSTLPDASQDFVIANHFLEHSEDPILTIKNLLRVTRNGGVIYLAVPNMEKTFDCKREETPLQHLIEDHDVGAEGSRRRHYEEWVTYVESYVGRSYEGEHYKARVDELMDMKYSIHFHCWTVEGFKSFLGYLSGDIALPFEISLFAEREDEYISILTKRPVTGSV